MDTLAGRCCFVAIGGGCGFEAGNAHARPCGNRSSGGVGTVADGAVYVGQEVSTCNSDSSQYINRV